VTLTPATGVLLFFAAVAGGAINSVAGGGSFVSFPALLFAGVAPVPANATNTIALWPGSLASILAYRRELGDVKRELLPLAIAAFIGGLAGSLLLLHTPESTFVLLIPWLLLFATVLFTFGGAVSRRLTHGARAPLGVAAVVQLAISVYGGYFGGGMGIMMLAVLTLLGMTHIHRMNALKNILGALINGVAVVAFVIAGAAIARRVSPKYVRWVVMVIAWSMTAYFFFKTYR
jgi:hypothetical protein